MTANKLQPPSTWPTSDDGRSLDSVDDSVDTPYPSPTALVPRNAGLEAGAFADWTFHNDAVVDALGNELEVTTRWNEARIVIEWRPRTFLSDGTVWIGLGSTTNRESEQWLLAGPARQGVQSWEVEAKDLPFKPTKDTWWFEILVDTMSLESQEK